MRKSTKEAIEAIKKAGFTHLKVEFEGDLGRGYDDSEECHECYGRGHNDCYDCDGTGIETITRQNGDSEDRECITCYGDGSEECDYCGGRGYVEADYSEGWCDDFIRSSLPQETRDILTYGSFYEDGSVDSEYTFTLPIEELAHVENVNEAFVLLSEAINGSRNIDVGGAGLHISVLTQGSYPVHERLPADNIDNFRTQVGKLLPALFFMASSNATSRSLDYRIPRVSRGDKYSAIYTHGDTCIEYRLFETCYDNFEIFYDYIEVIANTLKFYKNPTLTVESLGQEFYFNPNGRHLARFYDTPERLRVLNKQIKELKPKEKSYRKLKEERNFNLTIKKLVEDNRQRVQELKKEYQRYAKTMIERRTRPLSQTEIERIDHYIRHYGHTQEEAESAVRGTREVPSEQEFVQNNLRDRLNNGYMVAV